MINPAKLVLISIVLSLVFSATRAQRQTPPNPFTPGNGVVTVRPTPTRIPRGQVNPDPITTTTATETSEASTTTNASIPTTPLRKLTPANVDNLPTTPQRNMDNLPPTPANLPNTPSNVLPNTPNNGLPSTPSNNLPSTPKGGLPITPAFSTKSSVSAKNTPQRVDESTTRRSAPQTPSSVTTRTSTRPGTSPAGPRSSIFPGSTTRPLGGTATGTNSMVSTPMSLFSTTTSTLVPPTTSASSPPLVVATSASVSIGTTSSVPIPPTTITPSIPLVTPTIPLSSPTPNATVTPSIPFFTTSTINSGFTVTPPTGPQTNFPTPTTWNPISSATSNRPANEIVNSSPINVLLMLCNIYSVVAPPANMDTYLYYIQQQILTQFGPNFDPFRIAQITVSSNPDNGRLVLQFVVRPGQGISNSEVLSIINSRNFKIVDVNGNVFDTSCNDFKVIPWSEYWLCPDRRCSNDGVCVVNTAGQYSCKCKNMFVGKYCDTNLWPLLAIPAILFLMGLLLLCLCLWCCKRRRRLQTTKTYLKTKNETTTTTKDEKKDIESCDVNKDRPKPTQTFYIPYNRPLSVGFSDSRFTSVNAMTGAEANAPRFGGVYGVLPGVAAMGVDDPDLYYQSMGQRMALAFNDYTFAPNARASSAGTVVFSGQNGGSGVVNLNPTFTSHEDDMDDIANDGTGYYHALGQKLAITFDQQD